MLSDGWIGFLLFAVASLLSSACGDSTSTAPSGNANGRACEPTQQGAASCGGGACLQFKANLQNKAGMCCQICSTTLDCTAGGQCVSGGSVGPICLIPCGSDRDCVDGFVCVPAGNGASFCLVVPASGGMMDSGVSDGS